MPNSAAPCLQRLLPLQKLDSANTSMLMVKLLHRTLRGSAHTTSHFSTRILPTGLCQDIPRVLRQLIESERSAQVSEKTGLWSDLKVPP